MDPIDLRAYHEYLLWFAFTASTWPPHEPRFIWAANYFRALGFSVVP